MATAVDQYVPAEVSGATFDRSLFCHNFLVSYFHRPPQYNVFTDFQLKFIGIDINADILLF